MPGMPETTRERADRRPEVVALVANPESGSSSPEAFAAWLSGHGTRVASFPIDEVERAAASGVDRLVVAGGDGSLAPAAAAAARAGLALAVIPAGTANDFARGLGLPAHPAEACRLAALGTRERPLDLGWLEDSSHPPRPFLNVASAGLPAPAARRAASWKRPLGPLAYVAGALVAGLTERPLACRVECGGRTLHEGDAWQVTVACSGSFGAGAELEEADPADGSLDVVAVAAGARPRLASIALRLRRGDLSGHRLATHAACHTAAVDAPPGTEFNVDGDLVAAGSARFRVSPAAFRLIVP